MKRVLLLLCAVAVPAFSDGGQVILHKRTQALTVTVFASPAPPRAGIVDVSVLVQSTATLDPVLDAQVWLRFSKSGSPTQRVQATRAQAGNKFLYAAAVPLDKPGDWEISIEARGPGQPSPVAVSGSLAVASEQPRFGTYAGYLVLPFLALLVLALHQWLKLRLDRRYGAPARPNPVQGGRQDALTGRRP